jgi:hypothetical protein
MREPTAAACSLIRDHNVGPYNNSVITPSTLRSRTDGRITPPATIAVQVVHVRSISAIGMLGFLLGPVYVGLSGLRREPGLATFPYTPSAAFTGTRASNGDGIHHTLGREMPCRGTLGVVIAHRQPSQFRGLLPSRTSTLHRRAIRPLGVGASVGADCSRRPGIDRYRATATAPAWGTTRR